jgi:hypothetical protein
LPQVPQLAVSVWTLVQTGGQKVCGPPPVIGHAQLPL